ncbi:hypothetical protein EFP84_19095 [Leptospira kmetyi]|uniref:Uncharacterized protein n=1 Tax=Leptospira kmetyi TaxID=408139 RepID=A0AAD0XQV3_9LEPT|nr:hypothetical protein EFP84_19095 [Leptospira kmetyi]
MILFRFDPTSRFEVKHENGLSENSSLGLRFVGTDFAFYTKRKFQSTNIDFKISFLNPRSKRTGRIFNLVL